MVNTTELRQISPLRENTLRHVVEGDGRYPRAMTPSVLTPLQIEARHLCLAPCAPLGPRPRVG